MTLPKRRILVTGANGFIGRNLTVRLQEQSNYEVTSFVRGDDRNILPRLVREADAVIHLAGENRPPKESAFAEVNVGLTASLCDALRAEHAATGRALPLALSSSIQATLDTPYGRSKLDAERTVRALADEVGNPVTVFRLPGVFGKWCRPNYNSVVATFCHNIARSLPIQIDNSASQLRLVYVDDVVEALIAATMPVAPISEMGSVTPEYATTVGELAATLNAFQAGRDKLKVGNVGQGFLRALYATYVSYLPVDSFSYSVPLHGDTRGAFVEIVKTPDCGQFSFLTAEPGVTRGGHYHHTKTEKFLVVRGHARFRFRHLLTGEVVELRTQGDSPRIVETIPGWAHDVTNVGHDEMIVMLWANEVFEHDNPDTYRSVL